MTADGQALLKKPVKIDSSMVGSYKYGMIDFFRPIKATAVFNPLSGSDKFYTKAVSTIVDGGTDGGGRKVEYSRVGDTKTGPAEETVYMLDNGGVWFPFPTPFVISDADIAAKTSLSMDLVFNPADFGKASLPGGAAGACTEPSGNHPPIMDLANCVTVDMPYVRMNPAPRKSGTKTYKEVYTVANYDTHSASTSDLRVEIYYNDSNKDAILGVDSTTVMKGTATSNSANIVSALSVSQAGTIAASNAAVTLRDYTGADSMTGLVRRTGGNVSISCATFTGGLCTAGGSPVSKAYTYVGETLVSSD